MAVCLRQEGFPECVRSCQQRNKGIHRFLLDGRIILKQNRHPFDRITEDITTFRRHRNHTVIQIVPVIEQTGGRFLRFRSQLFWQAAFKGKCVRFHTIRIQNMRVIPSGDTDKGRAGYVTDMSVQIQNGSSFVPNKPRSWQLPVTPKANRDKKG